jgi:hypothetical protein
MTKRAHCNRCGGLTNHDVLATEKQDNIFIFVYEMLYLPRVHRRKPKWATDDADFLRSQGIPVPIDISTLMHEVYIALQNGSQRLVAMGD